MCVEIQQQIMSLDISYGLNVSYVGNLPIPISNSSLNLFKLQNKKEQDDKKNINGSWQKITK